MSKAGRPKKGSAGLPEWFDIEKYRGVKSCGAAEWFQQLAFRTTLETLSLPDAILWRPYSEKWSALVKEDPLITLSRVEEACAEEPSIRSQRDLARAAKIYMKRAMTLNAKIGNGVRPITYGEIAHVYRLHNIRNQWAAKLKKNDLPNSQDVEKEWLAQKDTPYRGSYGGIKYLRVDLSLPAALLKRDFAEYIKSQNKEAKELQSPFFKS